MSENRLREEIDKWEREANKFINETREAGKKASKDFEKQFKVIQDEGKKIMNSVAKESENADKNMKNFLDSLNNRAKTIQD